MSYQRDFRGPAGAGSTLAKPDSTVARVFSEKSAQLNADLARRKAKKQLEEKDQSKREIDIVRMLLCFVPFVCLPVAWSPYIRCFAPL